MPVRTMLWTTRGRLGNTIDKTCRCCPFTDHVAWREWFCVFVHQVLVGQGYCILHSLVRRHMALKLDGPLIECLDPCEQSMTSS